MKENVIKEKSYAFALAVVRFCRRLQEQREYVLSRQLIKAGTSVGANVEDAQAAQSRADFLSKMSIALKEARESNFWLRVLRDCGEFPNFDFRAPIEASEELVRILTSIVKTTGDS